MADDEHVRLDHEGALASIASALDRLATIAEKFFEKIYPEKPVVRDARVTTLQTDAEKDLQETIQGSEATLDEWRDLGPREREFVRKNPTSTKAR